MNTRPFLRARRSLVLLLLAFPLVAYAQPSSVKEVMDGAISRLNSRMTDGEGVTLDHKAALQLFQPEEAEVLATRHWTFDVDVPVIVSVARDSNQKVVPFWFEKNGFKKTELRVKNEEYTYEVWQKRFDAGHVGLGINGFDNHRPHYFVCVAPERLGDKLQLTNFVPSNQVVAQLTKGAYVYHDWPDLLFTEVPKALEGQVLLQTNRGRSRDAHLVDAFRKTAYPSSPTPDQVILTWYDDPKTTQAIQWRVKAIMEGDTPKAPREGVVHYREKDAAPDKWNEAKAQCEFLDDRLLVNDRWVAHLTAELSGLKPGTEYVYTIDSDKTERSFTTAPDGPKPFSFVFLTDTHHDATSGRLLAQAAKQIPDLAFATTTGDVVSTGLYRSEWDDLFGFAKDLYSRKPFVPVLGNHDNQDGLGPALYLSLFDLPKNGPRIPEPERVYSFEYANALFLVLDVTGDIEAQKPWIERQLTESKAQWKFVLMHFSPYCLENDEPGILHEWCPVFEKHHVDFVLSGHVHYYMRSKPIRDGKPVATPADGTIYLISVSVKYPSENRAASQFTEQQALDGKPRFVAFSLDGPKLRMQACDEFGAVLDTMTVAK